MASTHPRSQRQLPQTPNCNINRAADADPIELSTRHGGQAKAGHFKTASEALPAAVAISATSSQSIVTPRRRLNSSASSAAITASQSIRSARSFDEARRIFQDFQETRPNELTVHIFQAMVSVCRRRGACSFLSTLWTDVLLLDVPVDKIFMVNILTAFCESKDVDRAFSVIHCSSELEVTPTLMMFQLVLKTCRAAQQPHRAPLIWTYLHRYGLVPDAVFATTYLAACTEAQDSASALAVLDFFACSPGITIDCALLRSLIAACRDFGIPYRAHAFWSSFIATGSFPDLVSFTSYAAACGEAGDMEPALLALSNLPSELRNERSVFDTVASGIRAAKQSELCLKLLDISIPNAPIAVSTLSLLVSACSDSKDIQTASSLFERIVASSPHIFPLDLMIYNVLLTIFSNDRSLVLLQLRVLLHMEANSIQADAITFLIICSSIADAFSPHLARRLHRHIIASGSHVYNDVRVRNALINMFGKSGLIDEARKHFEFLRAQRMADIVSWNAMIYCLGINGHGQEALALFRCLKASELAFSANQLTYLAVLDACSHTGLVDDSIQIVKASSISLDVSHYTCLVDALGRANRLREAEDLIVFMQNHAAFAPNVVTWTAFLGACRIHGDVVRAEKAVSQIELLGNQHDIAQAARVLNRMHGSNKHRHQPSFCTVVATTSIDVNGSLVSFVAHDAALEKDAVLRSQVIQIGKTLLAFGYRPNFALVNRHQAQALTAEFEDKWWNLCTHSERIAIAFGLLHASGPLYLANNLRICMDCHEAIQWISKLFTRDIIIRDTNRFHHFKDGSCSCNNYF